MIRRSRSITGFLLALVLTSPPALARQTQSLQASHNRDTFKTLDLPDADAYRSGSGEPGEAYWQQRADYDIDVALDPGSHHISGSETITYTNNSPHELTYLWLQLDQNLFKPGSRGSTMQPPDSRWRGSFTQGGYDISNVEIVQNGKRSAADFLIDDTRMRITLDKPMAPGGSRIDIAMDFAFAIPEYGADRMGRLDVDQGAVYELAQWYPRMYVYDDVNGWNAMPYLGQGEFYLEYGDFDVDITVPHDFSVVATGELKNEKDVYTAEQRRRLDQARSSAETIAIIGQDEVGMGSTHPKANGTVTWSFHADNVRDVAWAASDAFILDAASWDGILLMSAYPKEGLGDSTRPGWEHSTEYLRHTISYYSDMWFHYPNPVAVNVAGVVGGMEYPGIVFCSVNARGQGLFGVTDHEFGHNWYPMVVGSDERRYAWMDEGFNTFINYYSNLDFYGEGASRGAAVATERVASRMQEPIMDQPIMTYPDQLRRDGLGFLAYRKPAKGLIILREDIMGPERFDAAFREYTRQWAFKHPQPSDFFRTMESVAGEDLDWFWRGWFYSTETLDQAIHSVQVQDGNTVVLLANLSGLAMPTDVEVTHRSGSTERYRIPVEAWATSDLFTLEVPGNDVSGVQLDPDSILPDIDRINNSWHSSDGATR